VAPQQQQLLLGAHLGQLRKVGLLRGEGGRVGRVSGRSRAWEGGRAFRALWASENDAAVGACGRDRGSGARCSRDTVAGARCSPWAGCCRRRPEPRVPMGRRPGLPSPPCRPCRPALL
jgi:hypothetical protein